MQHVKHTLSIFSLFLIIGSITYSCKPKNEEIEDIKPTPPVLNEHPELLGIINKHDSILFDAGFNLIDTSSISSILAEDFEFYHDLHGITNGKKDFLAGIQGLSDMQFTTWRTLREESTELFPLYTNNGQDLYGIIQQGVHEFYQKHPNEEAKKTSTAKFTHLWIQEGKDWKLKRSLSFEHESPEH